MAASPILITHLATGTVALAAAVAALSYRKGSHGHQFGGRAFAVSMLAMAASGAYLAFSLQVTLSIIGGLLTLYLVATSWATAVRRAGSRGFVELGGLLAALFIGWLSLTSGFEAANSETGLKDGFHPGQYFMFGVFAFLGAAGDSRLIIAGGISDAQRIARHLWRMCLALAIAASAFFLGQARLFPEVIRESQVLWVPVALPLLVMFYWLYRVLVSRRIGPTATGVANTPDGPVIDSVGRDPRRTNF